MNQFRVLAHLGILAETKENVTEASKNEKQFCKEIKEDICCSLAEYMGTEVSITPFRNRNEDHVMLGIKESEKLIEEAEDWNNRIFRIREEDFKYFEEKQREYGSYNLLETVRRMKFADPSVDSKIFDDRLFGVRRFFDDVDGRILYGTPYIVMDPCENSCEYQYGGNAL